MNQAKWVRGEKKYLKNAKKDYNPQVQDFVHHSFANDINQINIDRQI